MRLTSSIVKGSTKDMRHSYQNELPTTYQCISQSTLHASPNLETWVFGVIQRTQGAWCVKCTPHTAVRATRAVHSVKLCDAIFSFSFFYLFYFPISLLWCCHEFVARASVHQQSANGVLIRSWQFVLITVSHVFCAPFLQLMKSEAYVTKRLVQSVSCDW